MKPLLKSGLVWAWIAVLIVAIDRIAKLLVINNLSFYEPVSLLPFFNLTLALNKGAAFSFLHSASGWQNIFFGALAVVVSGIILIWLASLSSSEKWKSIALSFILGGAIGNLWDRIQYESVIDFFDFHFNNWHFAIFNTADAAIFIGAVMMILYWLFFPEPAQN